MRINLAATQSLYQAVSNKLQNNTISQKTVLKLDQLARNLYGIKNDPVTLAIMARNPQLFQGLNAAKSDIASTLKLIESMPDNKARATLTGRLENIKNHWQATHDKINSLSKQNKPRDWMPLNQ
jgi:hypothetical protein